VAILRVPIRKIFVPITHDLVHVATVDDSRQATHQLDEVSEGRGRRRPKLHVVDVAIEGLAQSVDKFCHAANLPPTFLKSLSRLSRGGEVEHSLRAALSAWPIPRRPW